MLHDALALAGKYDLTVLHLASAKTFAGGISQETQWQEFTVKRIIVNSEDKFENARNLRDIISVHIKEADLLHTVTVGAVAPLVGARVKVPWVHTEHAAAMLTPPAGGFKQRAAEGMIRKQLRRADRVVAASDSLGRAIQKYARKKVVTIGNQVHLVPAENLISQWDFSSIRMLGVGSLEISKHPELAVGAVADLVGRGYDVSLRWVGEGPLLQKILQLSKNLGVADRVYFLGNLSREQLDIEYSRANLFILPSECETFGVSLAEAAVAGLPVITGDACNVGGFLDPLSTELVPVAEYSQRRLASAVFELLSRRNLPDRATIAARARKHFDERARVQQYLDIYEELLNTKRRRAKEVSADAKAL